MKMDMCGRIEGIEEIFLESALSVLVQRYREKVK